MPNLLQGTLMLLLLMRHGIAEPLSESSRDDFHRVLTSAGCTRVHRAALGVRELVPRLDFLASSPKTRARQTTQIVRELWGKESPPLTEWSELMEDDFAALLQKLRALNTKIAAKNVAAPTVLLCGHEPLLSRFTSWLLTGSAEALAFNWKKAGVCALGIEFEPQKTMAPKTTLIWYLAPKLLRKIGK